MLKAKLKNHYLKKKIDQFSKTKSSSANGSAQKIKRVGIITSDNFFNKYEFSEILIKKLQSRYDRNIPLVKNKCKRYKPNNPWITKGILKSIRTRNRLNV